MLIAWLDGELDDVAAAELEARLATDSGLRRRLREHQRTWDMLDEVQATGPQGEFIKSTIEMVVSAARRRRARWYRWPFRVAIALVAFLLPALATWQTVRWIQNRPYREFVANLQFWENVDMYDQVESIEFLERLNSEGFFAEELVDER
jgi:anti-sigma factor RsiW